MLPLDPEALVVRLLLLTLAVEQANSDEDLTSLLNERAMVIEELAEAPLSERCFHVLEQVQIVEKRAKKALEAQRTLLATSVNLSRQGEKLGDRYRSAIPETKQRVA